MGRNAFLWAAAIGLAAALPFAAARAQDKAAPGAAGDDVVVTGNRKQAKAVSDYVRGLTALTPDDPLARYLPGEYCPAVLGLSPARNAEIAARMRKVAAAAGVRPAGEHCVPSALVFFVEGKDEFVRAFRARHPAYFMDPRGGSTNTPKADGPAVAWQLVQYLDPEGMPIGLPEGGGWTFVVSPVGGSRLQSIVTSMAVMSVVVVERSALVGLTATQVADYALMRTLTDPSAAGRKLPPSVSILGVLTTPMGSAAPETLTTWDFAYLKARYSGRPDAYAHSQAAVIRAEVRRALAHPDK